jgi:hypothetical protein
MAADVIPKAAVAAPAGYPYTSCGVYFGIDTVAVTGSAAQGEIGGLVGYSCPIGTQAFWFVEGDFNFANLNTTQNGISLSGPVSLEQRIAIGSPLSSLLSLFPSLGLQVPTLPVLPAGITVVTSHPYMFGALHEQDIGVFNGLSSYRQWEFSPGVGIGVLNQLSNSVALDVFAEAQLMDKAFCAPATLAGCNNVGSLYRVGMAIKY